MSIKRMTAVWEHSQHKGSELLLLLALADNASDDGYCWPGVVYLAKKIRMTPQSVIRLTKNLVASKELYARHNRRRGNDYIVRIALGDEIVGTALNTKMGYDEKDISNILLYNTYVTSELTQLCEFRSNIAMLKEPSLTVIEPSHGADAPLASSSPSAEKAVAEGEATLDEAFGPRKQPKAEPIIPTGDWTSTLRDHPWLTWGAESVEMERQRKKFGPNAEPVLRLGYELDETLGLHPTWQIPARVKTWMAGLNACLLAAEGDTSLVMMTARKMRTDGLTVKDPFSIEGMVAAAAAERRSNGTIGDAPTVFGELQV